MSGDAAAVRYGFPATTCGLCGGRLGTDDQGICQWYSDGAATPLGTTALCVCPDCRDAVAELVDTWTTVPEPPVDAPSLAAGYDRVADGCSFCERSLDGTPVGMEYYRAGTDHEAGLADVSHYALCAHCVGVFAEFLDGIATN